LKYSNGKATHPPKLHKKGKCIPEMKQMTTKTLPSSPWDLQRSGKFYSPICSVCSLPEALRIKS